MDTRHTALLNYLEHWLRWVRLRQALLLSLRASSIGLGLCLAVALLGLFKGLLIESEYLRLVIAMMLTATAVGAGLAYRWPGDRIQAARFFDRQFGLYERMSTALELRSHKLSSTADLVDRQLDDTVRACGQVNPRALLPFRIPRKEVVLVASLLLTASLPLVFSQRFFREEEARRAVEEAIEDELAAVEELKEAIVDFEGLEPEGRQALLEPLETALEGLQSADTPEQALSSLNAAESQLRALNSPESSREAQGMRELGERMAQDPTNPLGSFGERLGQGDFREAAQELEGTDPGSLDQAERQALADELERAAEGLGAYNPQLAEEMRNASASLREGDLESAQTSLSEAADRLRGSADEISQAELAERAASELAASEERILQAERSTHSQPSAGTMTDLGEGVGQGQGTDPAGDQGDGMGGGQGDRSGEGQEDGTGGGQGDRSGEGQGDGTGGGQGDGSGEGQGDGTGGGQRDGQGAAAGNGASTVPSDGRSVSGGAGRGEGGPGGGVGPEAGNDPIAQDNAPGDGGEWTYEPIHPSSLLGGEAGATIALPVSETPGDRLLGQVESPESEPGAVRVPYLEVLARYERNARQAIENQRPPPYLEAIVRTYFTSLEE